MSRRRRDVPQQPLALESPLDREALRLDPNDIAALAGQGEAMIQRGAVEKARRNLVRIEALCTSTCTEAGRLLAAIDKAQAEAHEAASELLAEPSEHQQALLNRWLDFPPMKLQA